MKSEYLTAFFDSCKYDEWNTRKHDYQQEYFFEVREYYKEVIKNALKLVDHGLYSMKQKKNFLYYLIFYYLSDLEVMESIWYPYSEGSINTWKYEEFRRQNLPDRYANVNIDDMKLYLVKQYDFIIKNPRYSHEPPVLGMDKDLYLLFLGIKRMDPDELLKKLKGK
jgi:hypothetical protein